MDFYDKNAESYANATKDMLNYQALNKFISLMPHNKHILDVGCGSGRDSNWFKHQGFNVTSIDISTGLIKQAKALFDLNVIESDIMSFCVNSTSKFGGIWASASLVHMRYDEFAQAVIAMNSILAKHGVMFISIKEGLGAKEDSLGRFNSYYTEQQLKTIILKHLGSTCEIIEINKSPKLFDKTGADFLQCFIKRK